LPYQGVPMLAAPCSGCVKCDLAADGLGARSVQIIHSTLRTMLSEAMREELIERNVATVVRPPSVEHVEVQPWSIEEAGRFLAASADHRLHALFAVGVALGLRKGELLALRWEDVDLDGGVLHVRQTCSGYSKWASYSVLQSRTSRAAQFRFPLPQRRCPEPTAQIRLPKPLHLDRPGSSPAWSLPQRSAR
jgi:integrase